MRPPMGGRSRLRVQRTHHGITVAGLVHITAQLNTTLTKMDALGRTLNDVVKVLDNIQWEAQQRKEKERHDGLSQGRGERDSGDHKH